jgi:hypothetical protein
LQGGGIEPPAEYVPPTDEHVTAKDAVEQFRTVKLKRNQGIGDERLKDSNGPQNQIGRIAFDDDAGLVTFSTELRG